MAVNAQLHITDYHKTCTWLLLLVLATSLALRLFLIFYSGELVHYDGPEYFGFSQKIHAKLAKLDFYGAFTTPVFAHWGCILLGTIPFFLKPLWISQQETSAIFFALPAILNIWLVYLLAQRFKLSQHIALLAACLYALSFTAIYETRHVYPHDLALSFFLAGILVTQSATRIHHYALAGFLHFCCFFTYYGYWTAAFAGMIFIALYQSRTFSEFMTKGMAASAGFLLPLTTFFMIGFGYGINYLDHFLGFSKTITMGSFNEGYSLPFKFLFYCDGLLFVLWLICIPIALKQHQTLAIKYSLGAAALIYLLLVIGSNVLQYFVVYGRLVKPIIPMLCIASACVIAGLEIRKQLVIFLCLLPGLSFNIWQLHRTTFWADTHKAYLAELKSDPVTNDRVLQLQPVCRPALDICGTPAAVDCKVIKSFMTPENIKYNQYDAVDPALRRLGNHYRFFYEIRDCPKTTP